MLYFTTFIQPEVMIVTRDYVESASLLWRWQVIKAV